jgi:hypothetical protein
MYKLKVLNQLIFVFDRTRWKDWLNCSVVKLYTVTINSLQCEN